MINRICWLHAKLTHDLKIVAVLSDDFRIDIRKDDILRKDNDCITILRPNGRIVVINPGKVMAIYTTPKEVW